MNKLLEQYADILLKKCKGKSLYISFDLASFELVEEILDLTKKYQINDIYLDVTDISIEFEEKNQKYVKYRKQKIKEYKKKLSNFMILRNSNDTTFKIYQYPSIKVIYGITPSITWANNCFPDSLDSYSHLLEIIVNNYKNISCKRLVKRMNKKIQRICH